MNEGPQTWGELDTKPVSVKSACISLDGTRIAALFADKTLCIYDTATGEEILPPFKVDEYPRSVVFSQDGKLVASGGQDLRLWNVETGEMVHSFGIKVCALASSPDGTCIAAGCEGIGGGKSSVDEREVLDGSFNIRVINLDLAKIPDHHDDPHLFIPASGNRIMRLKGEVLPSPFEGHRNEVRSVAYSADGKQIASCSNDQTVRVWDVLTGSRRTFNSYSNQIHSVTFSPDGSRIVSEMGLFNLSTGRFTLHPFSDRGVSPFAFSADGRYLASASGSVDASCQIWDTKRHQTILQLMGHTEDVISVAFFPDGKQIMTASEDGTIRIWDSELLEERYRGEAVGWRTDLHWNLGPDKENILWTPFPIQHPRNTVVIGRCLEIDFTNFVHGEEWWKCGEPLQRKDVHKGWR